MRFETLPQHHQREYYRIIHVSLLHAHAREYVSFVRITQHNTQILHTNLRGANGRRSVDRSRWRYYC